ncbi:MAG TPA: hypothetical protein VEK11_00815 [Thermoanaerobaculia bacterium]|nr:hypothetical protein [Thermoanaerobaculia bacterium]
MRKIGLLLLLFLTAATAARAQPVELKVRVSAQDTATRKRDPYFEMSFMFGYSVNNVAGQYWLNATSNIERRAWNSAGTGMYDLVFPNANNVTWCPNCTHCDPTRKPALWDSRCGDAAHVMWKSVAATGPKWSYVDTRTNTTATVDPYPTLSTWPYVWSSTTQQTGIPGWQAAINFAKVNAAVPNMVQPVMNPPDCRRELWNTDFDATGASNPRAVYVNGKWYMAFTGTVFNPTVDARWTAEDLFSVYWATSTDGKNWTVRRPLFRTTRESVDCNHGVHLTQLFVDNGYFYMLIQELGNGTIAATLLRAPIDSSTTDGFTSWQIAARDPNNANRFLWKATPANGFLDYPTLDPYPLMQNAGGYVKQTVITRVFASSSPFSPSMLVAVSSRLGGDSQTLDIWTAPDLDTPFVFSSKIDTAFVKPKGTWGYEPQFTHYPDNTPSTPRVVGNELDFWMVGNMNPAGTDNFAKRLVVYRMTGTVSGGIFAPRGALRTVLNNYVSAVNGGDGAVNATPATIGLNERFVIIDTNGGSLNSGDPVYLQVRNGKYLTAVNGGGGSLTASQIAPGTNETFTIAKANGGTGAIVNGNAITLRSALNYYVVAEGGGGQALNCNRTVVGPWETFTYVAH